MESSEDPSAKTNKGDLGFFSVFAMVYSFENACYKAKQGTVTMPFRTKYGYHIVKVVDSRPAQGEVKVAHIMLRATAKLSKEDSLRNQNKINEVYNLLTSGQKFEELAKQYSEDKGSYCWSNDGEKCSSYGLDYCDALDGPYCNVTNNFT